MENESVSSAAFPPFPNNVTPLGGSLAPDPIGAAVDRRVAEQGAAIIHAATTELRAELLKTLRLELRAAIREQLNALRVTLPVDSGEIAQAEAPVAAVVGTIAPAKSAKAPKAPKKAKGGRTRPVQLAVGQITLGKAAKKFKIDRKTILEAISRGELKLTHIKGTGRGIRDGKLKVVDVAAVTAWNKARNSK